MQYIRIRNLREDMDMTQTDMAKVLFISQRTYRAIPHKDCATDASSNFSSDETKSGVNT